MNPIHPCHLIRRVAGVLAGLAALTASLTTGPAAFASQLRPDPPWQLTHHPLPLGHGGGPVYPAHVYTVVTGGMPRWQIALIAAAAALAAATVAVLVDRARAARRKTITAAS